MMKKTIVLSMLALVPLVGMSQAKKPTLMVVPANSWCSEHGFIQKHVNQGIETEVPDFEKALNNDMELTMVITKIGELFVERGYPLKDLAQTIKSVQRNEAEDEVLMSSTSGSSIAETPIDRLYKRAKADIILEMTWKVNKIGPRQSVSYLLRALDAYTNKQVAAAQGTGKPSISAELPVLLTEAVLENMDNFLSQLQTHFTDILENGREVTIGIRVFDNGEDLTFESEYNDQELADIIEDWMSNNTVQHHYNLSDATETMMNFEQVRIPIVRENGRPMDTRNFVGELRKYLKEKCDITSKIVTKGLGRADLILGEK